MHLSGGAGYPRIVPAGKRTDARSCLRLQAFQFDGAVCWVCPLRSQCIAAKGRKGRRVLIHPQEALWQRLVPAHHPGDAGPCLQQSADYDEWRTGGSGPGWSSWASGRPATSVGSRRNSSCIWRPRWPISPWWRAKSGCRAVPRRQQATASSAMMSALWSPMRRPISAPVGQLWSLILSSQLYAATPLPNQRFPARF